MWHCLKPRTREHYLCPPEVVRRLQREFRYVETSEEDGRLHVLEVMQQLLALRQAGDARVDEESLARLERAQEKAICVYFGDDPTSEMSILGTPIVPEEPLILEYLSANHRRSVAPLVTRCAAALGYELIEG